MLHRILISLISIEQSHSTQLQLDIMISEDCKILQELYFGMKNKSLCKFLMENQWKILLVLHQKKLELWKSFLIGLWTVQSLVYKVDNKKLIKNINILNLIMLKWLDFGCRIGLVFNIWKKEIDLYGIGNLIMKDIQIGLSLLKNGLKME